jgi:hypothetical protein
MSKLKTALFAYNAYPQEGLGDRYDYIIAPIARQSIVQAAKKDNPNIKYLIYEFNGGVAQNNIPSVDIRQDPIGYNWITKHKPEWKLLDPDGNWASMGDYSWILGIDTGMPDCAMMWAACAIADIKNEVADGIFVDNGNSLYAWNYKYILPKYPTQESYAIAQNIFINTLQYTFKNANYEAMINVSGQTWEAGYTKWWISKLNGCSYEIPGCYGNGMPQECDERFVNLRKSYGYQKDKTYFHIMRSDFSDAAYKYEFAAYLLMLTTNSYLGIIVDGNGKITNYNSLLDLEIGQPLGSAFKSTTSYIWHREYEHASIYVNTSSWLQGTISLANDRYDENSNIVLKGQHILLPWESLILLKQC